MTTFNYVAIGLLIVVLTIWGVMALITWGKLNLWPRDSGQRQVAEREGRE